MRLDTNQIYVLKSGLYCIWKKHAYILIFVNDAQSKNNKQEENLEPYPKIS